MELKWLPYFKNGALLKGGAVFFFLNKLPRSAEIGLLQCQLPIAINPITIIPLMGISATFFSQCIAAVEHIAMLCVLVYKRICSIKDMHFASGSPIHSFTPNLHFYTTEIICLLHENDINA